MLEWIERRTVPLYTPPDDHPPPPTPPRRAWDALAPDGALLEAFSWGSALGELFVVEVRRYGAPWCVGEEGFVEAAPGTLHPPELPALAELQAAADQCVPHGTVLMVGVMSNGPDATYAAASSYRAVRMIQAAVEMPGRGRGVRS